MLSRPCSALAILAAWAPKSADPRGEDVSCKVHIGDYYDFRKSASCLSFARKIIAEPTGTEMMSKETARADRSSRVSKLMPYDDMRCTHC